MTRYRPNYSTLCGGLFIAALFLGFAIMAAIVTLRQPSRAGDEAMRLVMALFGLMLACFGISFLVEIAKACRTVVVDDDGIRLHGPFGAKQMLWRNLESVELYGNSDSGFILVDSLGARIELDATCYALGTELARVVNERIAPALEATMQRWRNSGAALRIKPPFGGAAKISLGLLTTACLYGLNWCITAPRSVLPDASTRFGMIAFALLGVVLFGGLTLYSLTLYLRVSPQGFTLSSLFSARTITFDQIESVSMRESTSGDHSTRIVSIVGQNGKRIMISAYCPNSAQLMRLAEACAAGDALSEGASELRKQTGKDERFRARFLVWMSPLYLSICLIPGPWFLHQGGERIGNYNRIETEGTTVRAAITGKSVSGSERAEYVLNYQFIPNPAVAASPVSAASPVQHDVWVSAFIGQEAEARYLTADPHTCHLTASISAKLGVAQRTEGWIYTVLGIVAVAIYIVAMVGAKRKVSGASKAPSVPEAIVHHSSSDVGRVESSLRRITLVRCAGLKIGYTGIALVMIACAVFLVLGSVNPAVHDMMESQHGPPTWFKALFIAPGIAGLAGMVILAPLGELYAWANIRALAPDLPDPGLASALVSALRASRGQDKALSTDSSGRLLNALTAALIADAAECHLSARQREFLYGGLKHWRNAEPRKSFCLAVIHAALVWRDPIATSYLREAAHANVQDVREAAATCLQNLGMVDCE